MTGPAKCAAIRTFWTTWTWQRTTACLNWPGPFGTTHTSLWWSWTSSSMPSWRWYGPHCSLKDVWFISYLKGFSHVFVFILRLKKHKRLFLSSGCQWSVKTEIWKRLKCIACIVIHLLVFCLTPFNWFLLNLRQQWNNEFISWDPAQFCGITQISVPKDLLWKPDLFIYEM